jgi:CheY-like chemotaxis protein
VRLLSNEGEGTIRVAVVDDQRLFTKGISGLVDMLPGVEVVAYDGEEAVVLCRKEEPDVVLMDISMPKMDGISATREIKDLLPQTAVVILTGHEEDEHVFKGIKAGAQGHVTLAPGRPLRGALRLGHGSQGVPHAPGPGEHDLLHQGSRLQGDERVSARRSLRGFAPHRLLEGPAWEPGLLPISTSLYIMRTVVIRASRSRAFGFRRFRLLLSMAAGTKVRTLSADSPRGETLLAQFFERLL